MHCASLGEFEQGRPLLEAIRNKYPDHNILLSFFSPSGYEIRKNYTGADHIIYLPMDSSRNARHFIDIYKPSLVLWVKYEYWYHYLTQLKEKNIPVLLVSGIFRSGQPFFKWYNSLWLKILGAFDHLFVQTERSYTLLEKINFSDHASITGDTRFDRVLAIARDWQPLSEHIAEFCENHDVLVAGSTWEEDEIDLIHYARAHKNIRFIIAPHEVSKERVADLLEEFPEALLYSALANRQMGTVIHTNVLIIDNIGMLSRLYNYASVAYIGGGFNDSGIHNILEAAVYGIPIVIGPVYAKFAEARALVDSGAAVSIRNAIELEAALDGFFENEDKRTECGNIAKSFVYNNQGATAAIMDYIQRNRLLTN